MEIAHWSGCYVLLTDGTESIPIHTLYRCSTFYIYVCKRKGKNNKLWTTKHFY